MCALRDWRCTQHVTKLLLLLGVPRVFCQESPPFPDNCREHASKAVNELTSRDILQRDVLPASTCTLGEPAVITHDVGRLLPSDVRTAPYSGSLKKSSGRADALATPVLPAHLYAL